MFVAHAYEVGRGQVVLVEAVTQLQLGVSDGFSYSDAQLDDYHVDGIFRWRPPIRMTLRARFSPAQSLLRGSAGFGFWNDPFGMTPRARAEKWWARLRFPQAVWFFFASPPSEMALAMGVPGQGWKAATLDAGRHNTKLLLPFAPLGMLACRVPTLYKWVWPLAQRVLRIEEKQLEVVMHEWHDYRLEWLEDEVRFYIDEQLTMRTRYSPRGPLGLVVWIDNQFMVATPLGQVKNGVVANWDQMLEIADLQVTSIS